MLQSSSSLERKSKYIDEMFQAVPQCEISSAAYIAHSVSTTCVCLCNRNIQRFWRIIHIGSFMTMPMWQEQWLPYCASGTGKSWNFLHILQIWDHDFEVERIPLRCQVFWLSISAQSSEGLQQSSSGITPKIPTLWLLMHLAEGSGLYLWLQWKNIT